MITREQAKKIVEDKYPSFNIISSYENEYDYEFCIERWPENDKNYSDCFDRIFYETIDKNTGEFSNRSIYKLYIEEYEYNPQMKQFLMDELGYNDSKHKEIVDSYISYKN